MKTFLLKCQSGRTVEVKAKNVLLAIFHTQQKHGRILAIKQK